jgi:DegT/DnrJ/EryC1/StrS aminotransferase family
MKPVRDVIGIKATRIEPLLEGLGLPHVAKSVAVPHATQGRDLVKTGRAGVNGRAEKLADWVKLAASAFRLRRTSIAGRVVPLSPVTQPCWNEPLAFTNNGRGTGAVSGYVRNGSNHRITEFQAALLSTQLNRLAGQAAVREKNAQYLTKQLEQISGISPARMYAGTTRNAYHLYMFRYDSEHFLD